MKKHILGLMLFGFIVGAATIIYRNVLLANTPTSCPTNRAVTVEMPRKVSDELRVEQAVYDLKAKLLIWKLSAPKVDSPVVLHFFVKDKNGARHIASGQGTTTCLMDAELNFTTYYSGLDNLKSYENLYVMAEFGAKEKFYNEGFKARFDVDKAMPVLIYIDNRPSTVTD